MLSDEAGVANRAARSLRQMHAVDAVPQLIAALSHRNRVVRRASARALASLGDRSAVAPMRDAAKTSGLGTGSVISHFARQLDHAKSA